VHHLDPDSVKSKEEYIGLLQTHLEACHPPATPEELMETLKGGVKSVLEDARREVNLIYSHVYSHVVESGLFDLTPREGQVITKYLGRRGPRTAKEVGEELGIGPSVVGQIRRRTMIKLSAVGADGSDMFSQLLARRRAY